jgi:hypothetical protein
VGAAAAQHQDCAPVSGAHGARLARLFCPLLQRSEDRAHKGGTVGGSRATTSRAQAAHGCNAGVDKTRPTDPNGANVRVLGPGEQGCEEPDLRQSTLFFVPRQLDGDPYDGGHRPGLPGWKTPLPSKGGGPRLVDTGTPPVLSTTHHWAVRRNGDEYEGWRRDAGLGAAGPTHSHNSAWAPIGGKTLTSTRPHRKTRMC